MVAGRTGVVLQNRSAYFTLDPRHPNRLEPRKRPLHTLIASLAFRDDKLWEVLGCMGADGQPQIHAQTYVATIDFGLDIQQAVETPRWLSGRFSLHEPRDLLNIEARFPAATLAELERRGHVLNRWGDWHDSRDMRTGSPSIPRAVYASAAAIRGATGPRSGTDWCSFMSSLRLSRAQCFMRCPTLRRKDWFGVARVTAGAPDRDSCARTPAPPAFPSTHDSRGSSEFGSASADGYPWSLRDALERRDQVGLTEARARERRLRELRPEQRADSLATTLPPSRPERSYVARP